MTQLTNVHCPQMMRPLLDLDQYASRADLLSYSVGGSNQGPRFAISVGERRPRTRWWQFWRPNPRAYRVWVLFDAPLSEKLMESWVKRLQRPSTNSLRPWERHAPDVRFTSPAIREALLREVRRCLEGTRALRELKENPDPDEICFFGSAVGVGPDSVKIEQALLNGRSLGLEGTVVEL